MDNSGIEERETIPYFSDIDRFLKIHFYFCPRLPQIVFVGKFTWSASTSFFSEIRGTKQFSKEFLQKIVLFFKNIKFPLWLFWQEISSSLVICRTFQIFFIFYLKLVAHKQASLTLYNPVLFLVSGNVTRCRLWYLSWSLLSISKSVWEVMVILNITYFVEYI